MLINSESNYDQYDFIGLYKNILTNDLVKYFQKRKIEVFVWGLNDKINFAKNFNNINNLYLIVNKKLNPNE